jgi:1-deoxy-D-xylulose-5-phosphate synthase
MPDEYTDHDKPDRMYANAGLDSKGIVDKVFEVLRKNPLAAKGRA